MAEKPGSLISKDRLKRVLGRPEQGGSLSPAMKTANFFAGHLPDGRPGGLAGHLSPTFVRHNSSGPNQTGLPMNSVAQSFFKDEGPDVLGTYAP